MIFFPSFNFYSDDLRIQEMKDSQDQSLSSLDSEISEDEVSDSDDEWDV